MHGEADVLTRVMHLLHSPELHSAAALKERLQADGRFQSVFMSGSGSTVVGFGADEPPPFLAEEFPDMFVGKCRLMTREDGKWYEPVEL